MPNARVSILGLIAFAGSCAPAADDLRDNKASRASSSSAERLNGRNPYSAKVLTDPYVLEQQHATVEALKRSCEQSGEHCKLAEEASRYLSEQSARR